jgi:hypothetical protein
LNVRAPFVASDLEDLDACLYSRADRVVPMRDVFKGDIGRRVIGLRHDVDDNPGSFDTALRMAEWEFDHGYSSTYFLLHTADYWGEDMLCRAPLFEEMGHEVGIHVNAIADGLRRRREPSMILARAVSELRSAVRVVGCVAHGDNACYAKDGTLLFVNDEMFSESPRPSLGEPDRIIYGDGVALPLEPVSRSVFGLEYDANWLSRGDYLSDSAGRWSQPVVDVAGRFGEAQLHMLVHPDWWAGAFATVTV